MGEKMRRRVLIVANKRTNVLTMGPDLNGLSEKTPLILIVPGNPGLALFYEHFMSHLYLLLKQHNENVAVWTVSHLGHDMNTLDHDGNTLDTPLPDHEGDEDAYSLHGQVRHKHLFLQHQVPDKCPLVLIGHSVGARIILDLISDHDIVKTKNLKMCYLLFPMIERMNLTPRGPETFFLAHYLPKLATFITWLIKTLLPQSILRFLVAKWLNAAHADHSVVNSALQLIDPTIVRNSLALAHSEFACVSSPADYNFLSLHKDKLRFYYGQEDGWAPLQFYHELVQNVPEIKAEICKTKMIHAFVLKTPEQMAEIVAKWCTEEDRTFEIDV